MQNFAQKQAELDRLNKKRDTPMDMRVEGILSKEVFDGRMKPIDKEIAELLAEISALMPQDNPEIEMPNYEEKIKVLRYALEQYNNWDDKDVPDVVIEAYVEKIVVSKDGFEWYLRFDGDPSDPLKCKVNGKRRQTATYTVAGNDFPAASKGNTGGYQGKTVIPEIFLTSFTLTLDDAKQYLYSFDTARRVLNWKDLKVEIWIWFLTLETNDTRYSDVPPVK